MPERTCSYEPKRCAQPFLKQLEFGEAWPHYSASWFCCPSIAMSTPFGRCDTSSEEETPCSWSGPTRALGAGLQAPACHRLCQPKTWTKPKNKAIPCTAQGLALGVKLPPPNPKARSHKVRGCAYGVRCDTSSEDDVRPRPKATATRELCPQTTMATVKLPPGTPRPGPAVRSGDSLATGRAAQISSDRDSGSDRPSDTEAWNAGSKPNSSGLFDYMAWAAKHVLSPQERRAVAGMSPMTVGCICAGIGAAEAALHAIRATLNTQNCTGQFEFETKFRAEPDRFNQSLLKQLFPNTNTSHFDNSSDLLQTRPKDVDGKIAQRPVVDLLVCGIDCKDMKLLNHKPSIPKDGIPSNSLTGLLGYVKACCFNNRPKVIILACAQRFKRNHDVHDGGGSTCAQHVANELAKQGYVGTWQTLCPTKFFLPLSRPRLYGLFLKLHWPGPEGLLQRQQDLSAALKLLARLKLPAPEPLQALLARCCERPASLGAPRACQRKRCGSGTSTPQGGSARALSHSDKAPPASKRARVNGSSGGAEWKNHHNMEEHQEQDLRLEADKADFHFAMATEFTNKEVNAFWLSVSKATKGQDWRNQLLVLTVGGPNSPGHSAKLCVFPSPMGPGGRYWVLDHGVLQEADGATLLATHGIQHRELAFFKLDTMNKNLVNNLNATGFTANVVAAFVLAGLSACRPRSCQLQGSGTS